MSRPKNKSTSNTDILKISISPKLVDKIEIVSRRLGIKPGEYVRVTLAKAIQKDIYELGIRYEDSI